MEPTTIIVLVALGIIAVFVIIKVMKALIKVAALLVLAALLYFFFLSDTDVFSKVSLPKKMLSELTLTSVLEDKCKEQDSTATLYCECIVQPIYLDLSLQYSEEELSRISESGSESVKVLKNALQRNKAAIRKCLIRKKGEELLTEFEDFVQEKAWEIAEEAQEKSH